MEGKEGKEDEEGRRIITVTMKALKCKPSVQFAYNYTINVLSKCSNTISHRSSVFEGRHNDHRSSKVGTSIIHLRRSTHLSSILEGRHIDRRSSNVDTDHRSSKIEGGNIAPTTQHRNDIPTIRHRILSTTALHSYTQDSMLYV